MCGIIAVLRARHDQPPLDLGPILARLESTVADLATAGVDVDSLGEVLEAASAELRSLDDRLRSLGGVKALVADPTAADGIASVVDDLVNNRAGA